MVYMPRGPKNTPIFPMYSEEEVYVRCSGTDFLDDKVPKWEFEKPVPGVVIGMVGERVLAERYDIKRCCTNVLTGKDSAFAAPIFFTGIFTF